VKLEIVEIVEEAELLVLRKCLLGREINSLTVSRKKIRVEGRRKK
jgi:hypothetical protein